MARYVMANRRAGLFQESQKRASRESLERAFTASLAANVHVVQDSAPADMTERRVVIFDAEPAEVEATRAQLPPDVMIEPEIIHWPTTAYPMDFIELQAAARLGTIPVGIGTALNVTVHGGGQPLEGAEVYLFLRGLGGLQNQQVQTTPKTGKVKFTYAPFYRPSALSVLPAGGFWSVAARGPSDPVAVDAPALPQDGPLGWWHGAVGVDKFQVSRGKGIKVGVIDTGVGPHPALAHVKSVGAFIDGVAIPDGGADSQGHGSHVCGIIGARPSAAGGYAGIAPGVSLFCARVFPPDRGADQGDIVLAIDALSKDQGVDLINMSLGASAPSEIEHDAIRDAWERGTVCVCAAGNSAGAVEYPARFPECVAVSALGRVGWGPAGTLAAARLPQSRTLFGNDNLYYPGNQDAHKADGRFSPQPAILATLCADLSCRGNIWPISAASARRSPAVRRAWGSSRPSRSGSG